MSRGKLLLVFATTLFLISTTSVLSILARHSTSAASGNLTPCSPAIQAGNQAGAERVNGLFVVTFATPEGKLRINLPDDMETGDTISGTVNPEPAGPTNPQRAANETELNGYVIQVMGQKIPVRARTFRFTIPITISLPLITINLLHLDRPIARTTVPISAGAPARPKQFTLPTGGQQDQPIEIKCPCNGVFSPEDVVRIGGATAPPLAESPRKIIVQDTSKSTGPTKIEIKENGAAAECPFRNIRIDLSAPKTNLKRGETTELHVEVSGLSGLAQDIPLKLANASTTVIKMSEGDIQDTTVNRSAVQANGSYSLNRTLTGIQPGSFLITGTVTWTESCTKDVPGGPNEPGPISQPTPTPLTPTNTTSGEVCKWINYKTYLVDEFKRVRSTDPNLEVRNESAHGGGTAVSFHCKAAGTFIFIVTKESGSDVVEVTCTQP
ncbi:MAG TPA: hypothetical protein VE961_04130 [Pyrinomonadaceae bacterium]|nr:hypothetical protein [Pyrinomonadaceae bacterium]